MNEPLWQRARAVFDAAVGLDPAERAATLETASAGDDVLRAAVEELLAADRESTGPLEAPVQELVAAALADAVDEVWIGRRVGPYEIESRLGRGGMGSVFCARRCDAPFEQRLALKLMRTGLLDPESRRRFDRERRILAALDHPGICRLIDGGELEGVPWLAMELVEGEEITAWCRRQELPTRARVELFLQVCSAISHAHQRLVVHRDLKPSHALVDGDGRVRLLDFGIAKLLDDSVPGTVAWHRVLTPEYASPEQVAGRPIGAASDTYQLGILLYELLTGAPPFAWDDLPPAAVLERIERQPPPRPSETAAAPRAGGLPAPDVARAARGDLDRIVLMALRPRAEERYFSVEALADDLRRWLDGFPVRASGSGAVYRFGRLLRRRPWTVAATAAAVAAIVGAAAVARLEQRRAESERDRAEAVTTLLFDAFAAADPEQTRGERVTAREVLDGGARRLLAEAPGGRVDLAMARTLGETYLRLGLLDDAARLLEVAARAADRDTPLRSRAALAAAQAQLAFARREMDSARGSATQALASWREAGERDAAVAAERLLAEIEFASGDRAAATRRLHELRARERRGHGEADPEMARTTLVLAGFENDQTRAAEAAALLAEARAAIDPRTALAVEVTTEEANVLSRLGRHDEAATRAGEALARARAIWGDRHPAVANALNLLGTIERDRGRTAEAERALLESLAITRELYGPKHPQLARTLYNQGTLFQFDLGRPAVAEPLYREAVQIHRAAFDDPAHPTLAVYLRGWGRGLVGVGRAREGLDRLREAIAIFRGIAEAATDVASAESDQSWALIELGRPREALGLAERALPILEASYGADHRITRRARERLARARTEGSGAIAPALSATP